VNDSLRFVCDYVHLRTRNGSDAVHAADSVGRSSRSRGSLPRELLRGRADLVRPRGAGPGGLPLLATRRGGDKGVEPNGSARNIAGICSEGGNVLGMMPHPERSSELELGSRDGRRLFDAMVAWLGERTA